MKKSLLLFSLVASVIGFAQLPINCNLFYTHNVSGSITNYNPVTLTSSPNSISCPGNGLAVSNNLNAALPAVTFYTTISSRYYYWNGSSWVNTGHNCSSSAAVNICGAGPYIYNLDGVSGGNIYRYDGTGTDVLVLSLSGWSGSWDLIGDENGNFYVIYTTSVSPRLVKYSPTGAVLCTYNLVGSPTVSGGGGYAIVGNKLYADFAGIQYSGTIVGTTITLAPSSFVTGSVGDFASCPFPQLNSGISSLGNLSCSTPTTALTVTTSVTSPSYAWSGPGIVSGGGTSSIIVNAAGIYTVVVTGSGGACPGAATSTFAVTSSGAGVTTAAASSSNTLTCSTLNVTLNGGPAGMTSYNWSGPGIVSGGGTATPNVNLPGIYTLTIVNPFGCASSTTVNVVQNTTPPTGVGASATGSITCVASTVPLTGSSSGGVTYAWTGPGFSGGTSSINAVATSGGTYTLTVTNTANGCTGSATAFVPTNTTPPTGVGASPTGSITCVASTVPLTGSSSGGDTYAWTGPGFSGGTSSINAVATSGGTYTLTVTNTANGCTGSATAFVPTNTTPPASTASSSGSITCATNTINLNSSLAGMNYTWTAPSGATILSGINTQNAIGQGVGDYTLTVLNPVNGCSSIVTTNITSSATFPTLTVTATNTIIGCAAPNSTLTASTSNTNTITWITPFGVMPNPLILNTAGTYTATITDNVTGCTSTNTISIIGNTVVPTSVVALSSVIPCGVSTISLSATSSQTTDIVYVWSGPSIVSGGSSQSPIVDQVGIYTVVVTNTLTGCTSSSTILVNQGTISAGFIADPTSGVVPLTVNFTDTSIGALTYSWTFDNGLVASLPNPSTIYPNTGTYNVVLVITNGSCSDTARATIIVEDDFVLEIPNVFSPNNDGANDIFTIKALGVKEISLQIFNRWGEKLYEFTGTKAAWDGFSNNGNKVPDGTYMYFVKVTTRKGDIVEKQGTLNLFR